MSLPAQHRLRHRRDFSKVYRHGNRYPSQHFVLRTLKAKPHKSKKGAVEELFPKQGSGDR
ncbi:MAG: ribonuclease P protein component, partial [Cyanobacteria bacterium P01_E01_bin.6]